MSKRAEEVFFQIKDPYLELHESEKFVVKQNELKKDARFQDAILRNTAYDPYYHKNDFNLSQTKHYFDVSDTVPPFRRPEITQEYVSNDANKTGTKIFYPSFLKGSFVDVQEKERKFESLLVRAGPQAPTEEEILQVLMQACMKEEQEIAYLQNNIQSRLDTLAEDNPDFRNTFKNYFRNLCTYMITGELKADMNVPVLSDEKGIIPGHPYNFKLITNMSEIHTKILALSVEEKREGSSKTIVDISNRVDISMNEAKNKALKTRYDKLLNDIRQEELQIKLKKEIQRINEEIRIDKQRKLRETKENASIFRATIDDIANAFTDTYLAQIKAKQYDVAGKRISWDTLIKPSQPIEDALKKDLLDTLEKQPLQIQDLRTTLFEFSKVYYKTYTEISSNIVKAEQFFKALEDADEISPGDDDDNIESIRRFKKAFDQSLEDLLNKRRNISTYSLTIEWFRKIYLDKYGSELKKKLLRQKDKITFWKNGDLLYDAVNSELIFTSRIYDKDGNQLRTEESKPYEDIKKEDIYYYNVKNTNGEDKVLVFDIATRKVGRNVKVHLKITTRFVDM